MTSGMYRIDLDNHLFDNLWTWWCREGVRGVAGVATATPKLQILFHKIVVLKWPKIPKVQIPQNPNIPKARIPKGPNS